MALPPNNYNSVFQPNLETITEISEEIDNSMKKDDEYSLKTPRIDTKQERKHLHERTCETLTAETNTTDIVDSEMQNIENQYEEMRQQLDNLETTKHLLDRIPTIHEILRHFTEFNDPLDFHIKFITSEGLEIIVIPPEDTLLRDQELQDNIIKQLKEKMEEIDNSFTDDKKGEIESTITSTRNELDTIAKKIDRLPDTLPNIPNERYSVEIDLIKISEVSTISSEDTRQYKQGFATSSSSINKQQNAYTDDKERDYSINNEPQTINANQSSMTSSKFMFSSKSDHRELLHGVTEDKSDTKKTDTIPCHTRDAQERYSKEINQLKDSLENGQSPEMEPAFENKDQTIKESSVHEIDKSLRSASEGAITLSEKSIKALKKISENLNKDPLQKLTQQEIGDIYYKKGTDGIILKLWTTDGSLIIGKVPGSRAMHEVLGIQGNVLQTDDRVRKKLLDSMRMNEQLKRIHYATNLPPDLSFMIEFKPFLNGRTLSSVLNSKRGQPFDEEVARGFLYDLLTGLYEICTITGHYHNDIHGGNVHVDNNMKPIILDFGRSKPLSKDGNDDLKQDVLCCFNLYLAMILGNPDLISHKHGVDKSKVAMAANLYRHYKLADNPALNRFIHSDSNDEYTELRKMMLWVMGLENVTLKTLEQLKEHKYFEGMESDNA